MANKTYLVIEIGHFDWPTFNSQTPFQTAIKKLNEITSNCRFHKACSNLIIPLNSWVPTSSNSESESLMFWSLDSELQSKFSAIESVGFLQILKV